MSKLLGLASTLMSIKDVALSTLAQFDMSKVENMLLNAQERTTSSGAVAQDQLELHVNKTQGMQPRETLATLAALIQQHFGLNINDADDGTLAALADLVQEQYGLNINDAGGMQLNETLAILADIMQKYFGLDINHALGMQPDTNRDQGTLAALVTEHIESLENTPSTSDPAPNMNNGALNQQNLNDEDHYEVDPDADDAEPYSESEEYYQDYDPDQLYTDSEEEDSEAIHTSSHENYPPTAYNLQSYVVDPNQLAQLQQLQQLQQLHGYNFNMQMMQMQANMMSASPFPYEAVQPNAQSTPSTLPQQPAVSSNVNASCNVDENNAGKTDPFKSKRRYQRSKKQISTRPRKTVHKRVDLFSSPSIQMNEIKTKSSPLQRVKESGESIINSIRKKENRLKESIAKVFFGKSKNDPRVGPSTNITSVTTAGPTQDENQPLMGEMSGVCNSTLGIENLNLSSKSADSGDADDSYLMHQFASIFPSDFLSIQLIKLSIKEVQEMLGQVHYFKEILGHLCQTVESHGFDGITLSFTNLDEVKESLNLDYGYWELFQMLILGLRRLQSE